MGCNVASLTAFGFAVCSTVVRPGNMQIESCKRTQPARPFEVCWPVKAAVGGFPARIRVKVFRLATSSHALLKDIKGDERDKATVGYIRYILHIYIYIYIL